MEQVEFKDFKIGELFEVFCVHPQMQKSDFVYGVSDKTYPLIMQNKDNNGTENFIPKQENEKITLIKGNKITMFTHLNRAFYQPDDFYCKQGGNIYILENENLNKNNALYFCSLIDKTIQDVGYGKNTKNIFTNKTISLPVTSSGSPNYSYMESYISYIEKLHVANIQQAHTLRIERILKELGYNSLKDAELTAEDKEILRLFSGGGEKLTLAEFKIGELFDTSLWKYSLQSQNFLSTSPVKTSTHDLAVVTGTVVNNSIAYYVNRDEVNESNIYSKTLTMTTRGQSGVVKFQEEEFLLHNNSLALCGVFEKLNKNKKVALYVMAALNKLGYGNSYSNFPTVKTLSEDTIPLPINPQSPTIPHYSLMESYITAIEKLHVNKLISSHNQEITTLNTVT